MSTRNFNFLHFALPALLVLYSIMRLINLTLLPIFNDEAIYLNWGWRELHLKNMLFLSLADAKQPFLMWIFGFAQNIFADPLFAGRVVSVITGSVSLLGLYFLGKHFFDNKTAITAALLYIFLPIFSFFDRQALMESSITAVGIWACYFFLVLFENTVTSKQVNQLTANTNKHRNVIYALALGLVLGLGFFIKSNALFFFIAIIAGTVYAMVQVPTARKQLPPYIFLSLVISQVILIPLYSRELFWHSLASNSRFSLTISELIHFPIGKWSENLLAFIEISWWYLTPQLFLIMLAGTATVFFKKLHVTEKASQKMYSVIIIFLVIPLFLFIITIRQPQIRYLVSFLPLVLLLTADILTRIFQQTKTLIVATVLLLSSFAWLTFVQIMAPLQYFSFIDTVTPRFSNKTDYVTSWPSGYGVTEAIQYVKEKAGDKPTIVGVRSDSGNPEDAVFTYFSHEKNLFPVYFDKNILTLESQHVDCLKLSVPFYYISRDNTLNGMEKYLEEVKRFYKPESNRYVGIYQIKKDCTGQTLILN